MIENRIDFVIFRLGISRFFNLDIDFLALSLHSPDQLFGEGVVIQNEVHVFLLPTHWKNYMDSH